MKIDVVVTTNNRPANPNGAGVAEEIFSRFPGDVVRRRDQRLEITGVSSPEESTADWEKLCGELSQTYAQWNDRSGDFTFTIDPATAPGTQLPTARNSPLVDWTPEGGKLRDVNGTAARAALLKLLADLAQSSSESTVLNDNAAASSKIKSLRGRAVVAPAETTETKRVAVSVSASRYAALDSRLSGVIAVIESVRGLACLGAVPVAVHEQIDFPTPASLNDFRRAVDGVRGLVNAVGNLNLSSFGGGVRSVSARESLDPLLTITAAGSLEHRNRIGPVATAAGTRLMFLGEAPTEIGASRFLRAVHGLVAGAVPAVNFAAEQKLREVLVTLIKAGIVSAARDMTDGGLMTAVCGMLFGGETAFGAQLDLTPLGGSRADALLFGESQGRVILAVAPERVGTVLSEAHMRGVSAALIGEVTNSAVLGLKTRSLETEWTIAELQAAAGG